MRHHKFHGRIEGEERACERPDCEAGGEFRAPGGRESSSDGPGDYRWLCLEHVREFNSGYDWFEGMDADEIHAAQSPISGWANQTRAFRPDAGIDGVPNWADYADPLEAINARAGDVKRRAGEWAGAANQREMPRFTRTEREALSAMGLEHETDRKAVRQRYSVLVRQYHPDRNGGDRSHEARLQQVVEAYNVLRKADALS